MKRAVLIVTIIALTLTVTTMPVFAGSHGGRHHGNRAYNGYSSYYGSVTRVTTVCNVESCTLTGSHTHNGTTYYSHYYGDGHTYHEYCSVADCAVTGYHEHDGTYHFGHNANDGHGYHAGNRHH